MLDLKGNRKLVKALVRIHNIPHYSFGGGPQPAMVIDQAALEVLRVKVKEWQARPRIAAMLRDRETAATT